VKAGTAVEGELWTDTAKAVPGEGLVEEKEESLSRTRSKLFQQRLFHKYTTRGEARVEIRRVLKREEGKEVSRRLKYNRGRSVSFARVLEGARQAPALT